MFKGDNNVILKIKNPGYFHIKPNGAVSFTDYEHLSGHTYKKSFVVKISRSRFSHSKSPFSKRPKYVVLNKTFGYTSNGLDLRVSTHVETCCKFLSGILIRGLLFL